MMEDSKADLLDQISCFDPITNPGAFQFGDVITRQRSGSSSLIDIHNFSFDFTDSANSVCNNDNIVDINNKNNDCDTISKDNSSANYLLMKKDVKNDRKVPFPHSEQVLPRSHTDVHHHQFNIKTSKKPINEKDKDDFLQTRFSHMEQVGIARRRSFQTPECVATTRFRKGRFNITLSSRSEVSENNEDYAIDNEDDVMNKDSLSEDEKAAFTKNNNPNSYAKSIINLKGLINNKNKGKLKQLKKSKADCYNYRRNLSENDSKSDIIKGQIDDKDDDNDDDNFIIVKKAVSPPKLRGNVNVKKKDEHKKEFITEVNGSSDSEIINIC